MWINLIDKKPDCLEVRILCRDGSEINCWSQFDGDFYWKGGGVEMFIDERCVLAWKPQEYHSKV